MYMDMSMYMSLYMSLYVCIYTYVHRLLYENLSCPLCRKRDQALVERLISRRPHGLACGFRPGSCSVEVFGA